MSRHRPFAVSALPQVEKRDRSGASGLSSRNVPEASRLGDKSPLDPLISSGPRETEKHAYEWNPEAFEYVALP